MARAGRHSLGIVGRCSGVGDTWAASGRSRAIVNGTGRSSRMGLALPDKTSAPVFASCSSTVVVALLSRILGPVEEEGPGMVVDPAGSAAGADTEPGETGPAGRWILISVPDNTRWPCSSLRSGFSGKHRHILLLRRQGASWVEAAAACPTLWKTWSVYGMNPAASSGAGGRRKSLSGIGREEERHRRCWRRRHHVGSWRSDRIPGAAGEEACGPAGSLPWLLLQ